MTDFSWEAAAIRDEVVRAADAWSVAAYEQARPSLLQRPRVFPDGDMWCALYGEDLMVGVCGFGETPEAACAEFDKAWKTGRTPAALVTQRITREAADLLAEQDA